MGISYRHPREETATERWSRIGSVNTADDYFQSLKGRDVHVFMFGEKVAALKEPALMGMLPGLLDSRAGLVLGPSF